MRTQQSASLRFNLACGGAFLVSTYYNTSTIPCITKSCSRKPNLIMQHSVIVSRLMMASCLLLLVVGCGGDGKGPTGTISGKLLLNGQPAPAGTQIHFLSNTGDATGAEVSGDGTFTIMGVTVGSYQVSVTPPAAQTVEMTPEEAMRKVHGTAPGEKGTDPDAFTSQAAKTIPQKFTDFGTSGVKFEVKEGSNDFLLDMK